MKQLFLFSLLGVAFAMPNAVWAQSPELIRIPMQTANVEPQGYGTVSFYDTRSWNGDKIKLAGVPKEWRTVRFAERALDFQQYAYQSYHAGKISEKRYSRYTNYYQSIKNTLEKELSKTPIFCTLKIARGTLANGEYVYRIDTNQNGSIADEQDIYLADIPADYEKNETSRKIFHDSLLTHTSRATMQYVDNGKIVTTQIPVYLYQQKGWQNQKNNWLILGLPVGVKGILNEGDDKTELEAFWGIGCIYRNGGAGLRVKQAGATKFEFGIGEQQYFVANGQTYQFLGIEKTSNHVLLRKVPAMEQVKAAQINFYPPEMTATNVKGESVSLADYKGKYVLLDCWNYSSGGKRHLKRIAREYRKLQGENAVLVSVLRNDKKNQGADAPWQIAFAKDDFFQRYQVGKTSPSQVYVINPEGKIVTWDYSVIHLLQTKQRWLK